MSREHTHGGHVMREHREHMKNTNIGEKMLDNLKHVFLSAKNERYLKRWTSRTDGDREGRYYVKRQFDANLSYFDLYWYVKRKSDHKRMETLYLRADETRVIGVIKETEEGELIQLFRAVASREEREKKEGDKQKE